MAGGRSNCSAAAPNTRVTSGWSSPTNSLGWDNGERVAWASGGGGPAGPGGVNAKVGAGAEIAGAGSALASASPLALGAGVSVVAGGLCLCIGLEDGDTDACDCGAENCHGE